MTIALMRLIFERHCKLGDAVSIEPVSAAPRTGSVLCEDEGVQTSTTLADLFTPVATG